MTYRDNKYILIYISMDKCLFKIILFFLFITLFQSKQNAHFLMRLLWEYAYKTFHIYEKKAIMNE